MLSEHFDAAFVGEGAQWLEELSCGPDAPCDRYRAIGKICRPSGHLHTRPVELGNPVAEIVEIEAEAVPTEGVGEDDVGAGVDEASMHLFDEVPLFDVEQLGTASTFEAEREEGGPHRPVGHQVAVVGEQIGERRVSSLGLVGHLHLLL